MATQPPILSPVDYDAWSRGYMPPSEHVLIDQLQFRGARVRAASSGGKCSWWLVINGKFNRKHMLQVFRLLDEMMEEEQSETPPEDGSQTSLASDGEGETGEASKPTELNPDHPEGVSR